uniref:Uncharacterized protein n=1 Tax=Glossina palpalis gambiensis TaxID=67801 RepID=A0A1B0ANN0_9MUSC
MSLHCQSIRLMEQQLRQEFKLHCSCISMRKHASTLKAISALSVLAQTIGNTKPAQQHTFLFCPDEDSGMLMLSLRLSRDILINNVCLCLIDCNLSICPLSPGSSPGIKKNP